MVPMDLADRLNNAVAHEIIEVPRGVYEINWCTVKVPITLVGHGRVIVKNVASVAARALRFSGEGYFHCHNLQFHGFKRAIELYPGFRTGAGDSEIISINDCTFDDCLTGIYGAYSSNHDVLGSINRLKMKNLTIRNSSHHGISIGCRSKHTSLLDSYVDGSLETAVRLGIATPRSPNPDDDFQNIRINGCDIRNTKSDHKVQAVLLMGRSIRVSDTHFEDNKVVPPYGIPVGHTSQHCSIYTKGSQVLVSGCDFHRAAGVMIKKAHDKAAKATITNNFFNSDLGSVDEYTLNEAEKWGVQAVSCTTADLIVAHNRIYGMEMAIGSIAGRSIVKDNKFRDNVVTEHWAHVGRTSIHWNSIDPNIHDVKDNDFDPSITDSPWYWRPLVQSSAAAVSTQSMSDFDAFDQDMEGTTQVFEDDPEVIKELEQG